MTETSVYCIIADLVIQIQGVGEYFRDRLSNYILPLSEIEKREYNCDIRISVLKENKLPHMEACGDVGGLWRWKIAAQRAGVDSGIIDTLFRTPPGFDDVTSAVMRLADNSAEISLLCPEELSKDALNDDRRDYVAVGQALSNLMLAQNRMILHSSCILADGTAVLFSAPSGTGKSTHTALWKKHVPGVEYINDDTPILKFTDSGTIYACGSPWSGKSILNDNISAPLGAVVFLERGTENEIVPIDGVEAMARLLGEARKLPFKKAIERAVGLCERIIENMPIYRFRCDVSQEAVGVVYREIFRK